MKFLTGIVFILISIPQLFAQDAVEERILQYFVCCDPCINAYEYVGFLGSGEFDGYEYDDGKIVRVPIVKSSTMSNGWYDFLVNIRKHAIHYDNSSAYKMCISTRYGSRYEAGPPAEDWTGKEQEVKIDTTITTYKPDFDVLNDSTYLKNVGKRHYTITFSDKRFAITSSVKDDIWNINIEFEEHGFPSHIYSEYRRIDVRFRYTCFDKRGNWIERETIDSNGVVLSRINRIINYNNHICPRCYGSGKVFPNPFNGPDESTGICGKCGGYGKGPLQIWCTENKLKELQDSIINEQRIKYERMVEYERREFFLQRERQIQEKIYQ